MTQLVAFIIRGGRYRASNWRHALAVALLAVAANHSFGDSSAMPHSPSAEQLIETLELEQHVEGGYFKRTFQADHRSMIKTEQGERFTLTSIYYLLTAQSPIGHWHLNRSDIIHFFHLGDPIDYFLIAPDGALSTVTLGPNPPLGHQLQMTVTGGTWKASRLTGSRYGLISEAVAPGFDYKDMALGKRDELTRQFPQHKALIETFTRD
ncbi:cupin domain-containing protein [Halioxenophilus aromaticivorans]